MSGILGVFNLNGEPVTIDTLQTMRDAMAYWGPDGSDVWCGESVGLGQLMLYNTPECLYERLPHRAESDLVITAAARIDNRSELCDLFGIRHPERSHTSDSDLILRAYEKWREDCPDHLLGDWSFAIWNPTERRLFIARDHHGNTALYYYQDTHRFAFASCQKALFALGVPRRLNELYLAQVLVSWFAYHGSTTIDLDIFRLPPAHAMTITSEGTKMWRYWHLENTPEMYLPSFDDYVQGLLEVYTEAVRCRLRSYRSVGVTLSGGLDSSSVTALAAREFKQRDKRLAAFTAVPIYDVSNTVKPDRLGDESSYAQATARFVGNIDVCYIMAQQTSPVAGIRRMLELLDEPGHGAMNFFWLVDLLATAQQQGVGTLLTGQEGNATISWVGAPELRSLRVLLKRQGWRAVVKRLAPTPLLHIVRQIRDNRATWRHTPINIDFARRLRLAQRRATATDITNPDVWRKPQDRRYAMLLPGRCLGGNLWARMGAGYGIEVRDPTCDKRVLAYSLAVPDRYFTGPDGIDRRLIRHAMVGLLPDKVRLNRRWGRQAADAGKRLLDTAPELEDALTQVTGSERATRYLNLDRMRAVWTSLQENVSAEATLWTGTILLRGLMAGLFLTDFTDG